MSSGRKEDDAVSPVIGVMLMLVIVLIIAAVISVFASGLVSDTEAAPAAVISLEDYSLKTAMGNPYISSATFKHVSGDSLNLDNMKFEGEYNFAVYQHELKDNNEWKLLDSNEDGFWGPGELLTYTYTGTRGYNGGLFAYYFSNKMAEMRFVTLDNDPIALMDVYIRGDSAGGY